jgi:DNA-binding CsgD family transcriptional regulator
MDPALMPDEFCIDELSHLSALIFPQKQLDMENRNYSNCKYKIFTCGVDMKYRQEATIDSRKAPFSAHIFFSQVVAAVKDFGFDSCQYKIQMPIPICRPIVLTFNSRDYETIPPSYQSVRDIDDKLSQLKNLTQLDFQYDVRSLHRVESEQIHSQRPDRRCANMPRDKSKSERKNVTQTDLRKFVRSLPLNEPKQIDSQHHDQRWAYVSRDTTNGTLGQLTLCQRIDSRVTCKLSENKTIEFFTSFAHEQLAKLLVPSYVPEVLLKLTPREKEVLRWVAEGKTSSETGEILSVSVHTISFHLKNVMAKLNVTNKTQAAVKASVLGLLL